MPRLHRTGRHFGKRLYLRIWLALLAGLLLTALLAGGAWRLYGGVETPREISLTDAAGADAGRARLDFRANPGTVRIEMDDGRVLFARWRDHADQRAWPGFAGWLLLIAAAVGLGAYPVIRRLTRRLESLQQAVDALGEGDLAARVPVRGHDEIAYLATRFNHAAERIEALVGAHKSMLANASHELRSPLTRIRMAVEMLDHGNSSTARAEIARSIVELDALVEEILLLSRLQAHAMPDEPFGDIDLTALAAEECARAGALLHRSVAGQAAALQLARFFSPDIAATIVNADEILKPGSGRQTEAAAMFIDMRGFTRLAASMAPGELVGLLGDYQKIAVPVIQKNGGSVITYLGDGIMVTFGANRPSTTFAADALRATAELLDALEAWAARRHAAGQPAPGVGIGVEVGTVTCGAIGDDGRLEYAVIGDPVNRAAKLQNHTKVEQVKALASAYALERALAQGFDAVRCNERRGQRPIIGIADPFDVVVIA